MENPEINVCVITASICNPNLLRCLQSVQAQTYHSIQHYVVVDGPEHEEKVAAVVETIPNPAKPIKLMVLPEATGKDGWICHRIYGAMPFLVNSKWVCFLDDDNWIDPNHVQSLLDAIARENAVWAFSLRKIFDMNGNFVELDQCESLGTLHPVFHRDDMRLVDTNCYFLRRDLAVSYGPIWNRPRHPKDSLPPDFELCAALIHFKNRAATNSRHTLNYTVGNDPKSNVPQFFRLGNARMRQRYPNGLPWEIAAKG